MDFVMKQKILSFAALTLALSFLAPVVGTAATGSDLVGVYRSMETPVQDMAGGYDAAGVVLELQDMTLAIDSGQIFFFAPLTVNDTVHYWGAYFAGSGRFRFNPQLPTEQTMLYKFFASDSLNRWTEKGILLFNDTIAARIRQQASPLDKVPAWNEGEVADLFEYFTRDEQYYFVFSALRNAVFAQNRPFFLANLDLEGDGNVFYMFDPYLREEVHLHRELREFLVTKKMEPVCSYSVYADPTYFMYNGIDRQRIHPRHYSIKSAIDSKGKMSVTCEVLSDVLLTPSQMIVMRLHERAKIDSIRTGDGVAVPFLRFSNWDNRNDSVYLFLDRPYHQKERLDLTFYYGGDIVDREAGVFYVEAGSSWYPRVGVEELATYDLTFETPKDFEFVASGEKLEDEKTLNVRRTRWVSRDPVSAASFNIGDFERYEFANDIVPLEIYIGDTYRRQAGRGAKEERQFGGRAMRQQVADDISGALKLYTHVFGPFPHPRLIVSETRDPDGASFPGLVQLNWETVFYTDDWGANQLHRANMVARQWFGNAALYDSYHDQWLQNSIADYAALMYLQAAEGNERFLWWLGEYRKEILSMHGLLADSRGRSLPVALGHRVVTSETDIASGVLAGIDLGSEDISRIEKSRTQLEVEPMGGGTAPRIFRPRDVEIDKDAQPSLSSDLEHGIEATPRQEIVIFHKGAFVMHMLRQMLLDLKTMDNSRFSSMMREYMQVFKGRHATTHEFQQLTEKYCGIDMGWFFDQWVYGSYIPTYKFDYAKEKKGNNWIATLHVRQENVPDDFRMYVPFEVQFRGGGRYYDRILVDRPEVSITLPPMDAEPQRIILNPFESVLAKVDQ